MYTPVCLLCVACCFLVGIVITNSSLYVIEGIRFDIQSGLSHMEYRLNAMQHQERTAGSNSNLEQRLNRIQLTLDSVLLEMNLHGEQSDNSDRRSDYSDASSSTLIIDAIRRESRENEIATGSDSEYI